MTTGRINQVATVREAGKHRNPRPLTRERRLARHTSQATAPGRKHAAIHPHRHVPGTTIDAKQRHNRRAATGFPTAEPCSCERRRRTHTTTVRMHNHQTQRPGPNKSSGHSPATQTPTNQPKPTTDDRHTNQPLHGNRARAKRHRQQQPNNQCHSPNY
jgi:hypothetical protein